MLKKTSIFVVFLLINYLFFAQNVDNFGKPAQGPTAPGGQQLSFDGFNFPKTKMEEKARKKALRLSLSRKEMMIYLKKENGKKLNFWQSIRYPSIKHRKKKLEKLQAKYKAQTDPSNAQPGYVGDKYNLTIKEKEIMERKEKNDSLSAKELKIYNKAIKKQEKKEKLLKSFEKKSFTDQEEAVKNKAKINVHLLSPEEKETLKQIREKEAYNQKVDKKRINYQTDSVYNAGGYIPKLPFKYRIKKLLPSFKKNPQKPSSYMRKVNRLQRIYAITEEDKELIGQYKSGQALTPIQKLKAERASTKSYNLNEELKILNKKYYLRYQPKESRKLIKKSLRKKSKK